jgi:hypothetical protein
MNIDVGFNISHSIIQGCDYYTLKLMDEYVGKCIIQKTKKDGEVLLKYIEIKPKFRGMKLSNYIWYCVKKELIKQGVKSVILVAEETDDRHNKLVKLYQSWGFEKIVGGERYVHRDDFLIRQVNMKLTFEVQ